MVPLLYFIYHIISAPLALVHSQTPLSLWKAVPCDSLKSLSLENTTILEASYVAGGSNIVTPGSCQSSTLNTVNLCRVYGVIETSSDSAVKFEAWLPDTWYGRFLSLGNGGLGGCIDYANLDYGTSLHFASVGADGGHDGNTALPLLIHPEVIKDFSYRSVHVASVIGKQIVEAYYNQAHSRSYYLGCSAGGRQGIQSALLYPEDFDGIIGGSPAVNWNHFVGSGGIFATYFGAPNPETSDTYIQLPLWRVITREILKQCDALDILTDGIIAEPDKCDFNPDPLFCVDGETENCLTNAQVDALRSLYQSIDGTQGQLLWPRYDPGAELDTRMGIPMDGEIPSLTEEWMKYTIYNDTNHSFDHFNVSDIEFADTINPGGIATWSGEFSAFRDRGGKFLTYHGRSDTLIPSGNSKQLYELILSTLNLATLDDFYRFFLIPGMFHCQLGGAWAFGQGAVIGAPSNVINDTTHNILLAMVEWVEGGIAPEFIIGSDDRLAERKHCRYPYESMWNGLEWTCV